VLEIHIHVDPTTFGDNFAHMIESSGVIHFMSDYVIRKALGVAPEPNLMPRMKQSIADFYKELYGTDWIVSVNMINN
jgi:hypothetical protein